MNVRHVCKWCVVSTLLALGLSFGLYKALFAQPATRPPAPACRARGASAHARAGSRGLRGNRDLRSRAGHRGAESAAGCHRRSAAGTATGGGQRRVDSRLLGLGRRAERFPVGQRHLARPAARPPMGARLLGQVRARLSMDFRLLGRCPGERGGILARAARDRRSRSQHCRIFGRPNMAARLLGVAEWPLCLAARFLGDRAAELGLGSRPLRLGPARLRLRRRLLGLLHRPSRRAVCAGVFQCGRVWAAGFLLFAYDGDRPGRVRQPSLLAAAIPTLLLRRLLRRRTTKPRGSTPRIRTTPAVSATIRFTLTTAGSIGRTADGNSANRRTSKTAAITRICDRRAPGRPREQWTRVRCRSRARSPVVAAPLDEFSKEPKTVRCDSSRWTRQSDKGSLSKRKRSNDSANSGKSWKPARRVLQPKRAPRNSRRPE